MCGLTGFWGYQSSYSKQHLKAIVSKMSSNIQSRGPDSSGVWVDENKQLAIGHQRLSIIDLSLAGHQPMCSRTGNSVIAYNGEVYNANDIRDELVKEGVQFKGYSDTEVVVEACEIWGVTKAVKKLIGMFAFALWDVRSETLVLVRDRLGIKPLYWGNINHTVFFGSQLKSFYPHPKFEPAICKMALSKFLQFNYIPAPYSIFDKIYKVNPGTILRFTKYGEKHEEVYWQLSDYAGLEKDDRDESDIILATESLMKDSISKRMISDVPLGAFLSGGIDSSVVVALMQSQASMPVKTFSIGFSESDYNEAHYAKRVAKHLGTEHHEWYVTSKEAQDVIPKIPDIFDEPFADMSQIPTYLVSKLAREHVAVSLSGDGGDELFSGYNRYKFVEQVWDKIGKAPYPFREIGKRSLTMLPPKHWDRLSYLLPKKIKPKRFGDKIHKFAKLMSSRDIFEYYEKCISFWQPSEQIVSNFLCDDESVWSKYSVPSNLNYIEKMQLLDTYTYLPDDILAKVDRASMAVGLEARVPLLDHRLVEAAWKTPFNLKMRKGQTKWILRKILEKYVPNELIDRPKMGFGVPVGDWLRGPLKEWAEQLLSKSAINDFGYLRAEGITEKWQSHLTGVENEQYSLWGVLMFHSWLQVLKEKKKSVFLVEEASLV